MRFQVPQFIEIEDKIFGPLTIKQFIYMAGGAGLSFLIYVTLDSLILSVIPIVVVMGISGLLAFYKVNNRPLVSVVESAFRYYIGNKLYVWKKEDKPAVAQKEIGMDEKMNNFASLTVPKISDSKLKDLTWSLDIQDSIYTKNSQK